MKMQQMREIANAVLYEGYLLYPYRRSAIKNRQRWTIGVVAPRAFSAARGGTEPWTMRTECLVTGQSGTTVDVTLRFLHLLTHTAVRSATSDVTLDVEASSGRPSTPASPAPAVIGWAPDSWEEGMEREVAASSMALSELVDHAVRVPFAFPAARIIEPSQETPDEGIVREQQALAGAFTVAAVPVEPASADAYKLTVEIENTTPLPSALPDAYNAAMPYSLVSAHTILQVHGGAFVSLLDPPEELRAAASGCRNEHTYPVLLGDEGDTDTILSSPIILYDYPRIAPESAGALFDGTEIDEILTLRILALSDDEKAELRMGDARAREILERTESLTAEQLLKLHGVIRSPGTSRPAAEGGGA